ncbi:unnamed protein product [Symbiodinium necroappetens]|uniref:Uncharacterized protein n=1 Tax=Symbiodinium necroappetens TaxID=1628268 RepID=A0A812YW42_9DINO|nr:unnamed protein product [Symbiodinium necroappetens]
MSGADALVQGGVNLFNRATGRPVERTMGEAFQTGQDVRNTMLEAERDAAPIRSALAEGIGGFAAAPARTAQAGVQAARGLSGLAQSVGKGAAVGAAGGATYGAGTAERGEVMQGAQQGATIGGALGAAFPLLTSAGGALARQIKTPRADQQVLGAARRAGIPDNLDDALSRAREGDFVAEAVGGNARRVAQGVPGLSEDAAEIANRAIDERQAARFDRLMQGVRQVSGDDGTRAATVNINRLREEAAPLFRQVDENVISATPAIRQQVRDLRRAGVSFADADRLAALEGGGNVRLSALADDMDLPDQVRLGDVRALIGAVESRASRAFGAGDGVEGRAFANRARALRNALKEADPSFREASRLWHSAAQDDLALNLGRDVFSGRAGAASELEDFVEGGLSASERRAFMQGVTEAIESRAARASEQGGNAASRFNPRYIRDRLRLVFGEDADQVVGLLDQLNNQASFENMAMRSVNSATQGRAEAERAARSAMRTGAADAIRDIRGAVSLAGPRNRIADAVAGTPDQMSADMARLLFRPADMADPDLQRLLQAQARRRGLFGRSAPAALPAYVGAQGVNVSGKI